MFAMCVQQNSLHDMYLKPDPDLLPSLTTRDYLLPGPIPYRQLPRLYIPLQCISSSARVMWFYNESGRKQMDDLSCYAIAFLCACDKHLATYETSNHWLFMKFIRIGWLTRLHKMHIWSFKMEAAEHIVEARLLDENSHNGYSIWVTIPQVDFRV